MVHAQTGVNVIGYGYRVPANAITAAPGQVLAFSVLGVTVRTGPFLDGFKDANAPATELMGLSVRLQQGTEMPVALGLRAIQQSACPASGPCSPVTTFTVRMPYELSPDAALTVLERGTAITRVTVRTVPDDVHVLNTCDQIGIGLSLAFDVPAGECAPMVIHPRGPRVSRRAPAKPGDLLVAWAWGLGAVDEPGGEFGAALAKQPISLNFAYPGAGGVFRRVAQGVTPAWAGMVGEGLYQVHFTVPDVPVPAEGCTNLRVVVSGVSSADAFDVCVGK